MPKGGSRAGAGAPRKSVRLAELYDSTLQYILRLETDEHILAGVRRELDARRDAIVAEIEAGDDKLS